MNKKLLKLLAPKVNRKLVKRKKSMYTWGRCKLSKFVRFKDEKTKEIKEEIASI
jgi:hypothetical protein